MYSSYAGKLRTDSNIAWHRPQSNSCRVDEELMQKSARALVNTTDPLEKLRLLCLMRGASGIMGLGRIFRKLYEDGRKQLSKKEFCERIKDTGLEITDEEVDALFTKFDPEDSGTISLDEFIKQIRPPMSERRRAIVEQAFRKIGKGRGEGDGFVTVDDLAAVYCVCNNPRYKSGEETAEVIMHKFLHNFETEGTEDGKVTMEEFMNYYSAISVSIDEDSFFDLMMRQTYKL